jgi:hypothetical protein
MTWPEPEGAETVAFGWHTAAMPSPLTPEGFDDLHDFIKIQVAGGYAPAEEIIEDATALFAESGMDPAPVRYAARTITDQVLAAHLAEQVAWPEPTDNDRLDAAFAELDGNGILARQHFACCETCGAREIHDELDQAEKTGRTMRGFTFFHRQDTEHAVGGEGLYLSFGSIDRDGPATVAIGHEVVDALTRHGLSPAWNGKQVHRISLPLVWCRRR